MKKTRVLRMIPCDPFFQQLDEGWVQSEPGVLTQQDRRNAVLESRAFFQNVEDATGNLLRILTSVAMDVDNYDYTTRTGMVLHIKMALITQHLLATRPVYVLYKIHSIAKKTRSEGLFLCLNTLLEA